MSRRVGKQLLPCPALIWVLRPWDRPAAAPGADEAAFDDHLRATLDASLLEARGAGEAARYGLHPLTRAYLGRTRPPDPATLTELRRRHAAYFLQWAKQHQWDFDALEADLPGLSEPKPVISDGAALTPTIRRLWVGECTHNYPKRCGRNQPQ